MLEEFPVEGPLAHSPKPAPPALEGFVSESEFFAPRFVEAMPDSSVANVMPSGSPKSARRGPRLDRKLIASAALGVLVGTAVGWRFMADMPSAPSHIESTAAPSTSSSPPIDAVTDGVAATQQEPAVEMTSGSPQATRVPVEHEPRIDNAANRPAPLAAETGASPMATAGTSAVVLEPLLDVILDVIPVAALPAAVPAAAAAVPAPELTVVRPLENAPAPPAAVIDERSAIQNLLGRYRTAYADLDAPAVKQIWPSASEAALAKAFAGLESQSLEFYDCDTTINGQTAQAVCDGQVSFVGLVGPRQPRTQNREWAFTLRKIDGDRWEIDRVQVR